MRPYTIRHVLALLLLAVLVRPHEARAQYADPCAGVQCPPNSACVFTNVGAVCGCNPGYEPDGQGGCLLVRCTSSSQCAQGEACSNGQCVPAQALEDASALHRRVGLGLLIPGLVLAPAGTALVVTGFVFRHKSRSCSDVLGIRVCDYDESSHEYMLYRALATAGIISAAAGITLIIVGAVRLGRARSMALARPSFTPFLAALPSGAMVGVGGYF